MWDCISGQQNLQSLSVTHEWTDDDMDLDALRELLGDFLTAVPSDSHFTRLAVTLRDNVQNPDLEQAQLDGLFEEVKAKVALRCTFLRLDFCVERGAVRGAGLAKRLSARLQRKMLGVEHNVRIVSGPT